MILSWFDLGPTLKTLNLSFYQFYERPKFKNHVGNYICFSLLRASRLVIEGNTYYETDKPSDKKNL